MLNGSDLVFVVMNWYSVIGAVIIGLSVSWLGFFLAFVLAQCWIVRREIHGEEKRLSSQKDTP